MPVFCMRTITALLGLGGFLLVTIQGTAIAATAKTTSLPAATGAFDKASAFLITLFIISAVFEAAMTSVFNWRHFATRFEGKGIKTPVMLLCACLFCWLVGYYVVEAMLTAFGVMDGKYDDKNTFAKILDGLFSGLIIGGGSGAIYTILTKLQVRDPNASKVKAAIANPGKADVPPLPQNLDRSKNLFAQ